MANEQDAPVKILDWGGIYRDSLTREILRSERRRVSILAALFAFAACVFSIFSFVPGLLDPEFRARFQAQWPWMISLYGAVIAYEWALRAGIGWLIEHRRQPPRRASLLERLLRDVDSDSDVVHGGLLYRCSRRARLAGIPALFLFYPALDSSTGHAAMPLHRLGRGRGEFYFCPRRARHIWARG